MAPPGQPINRGKLGGAQVIQFPGSRPTETPDIAPPSPVSSVPPPSDPISSPTTSRPSFHGFSDFSNIDAAVSTLGATVAGQNPKSHHEGSAGNYGKIKLGLEILANPTANGGYDAHFVRANEVYDVFQEMPGDPIRVQFFKLSSAPSSGIGPGRTPQFQLTYYPNGEVGYAVRFENDGKPVAETKVKEGDLKRAALGAHEQTLFFIKRQQTRLADARNAFQRMEDPLTQLRPSDRDLAKRAAWYDDFAVVDGRVYSLRTQNFGFGGVQEYHPQHSIAIYENQGSRKVELFRISKTGEINYLGEGSPRRPPDPKQFFLIDKLSHQLEQAQANPELYQTRLHARLQDLEKSLSATFERTKIARTALQLTPNPAVRTTLGEPMVTITHGGHLWRLIRPFSWGWQWETRKIPKEEVPEAALPFRERFRWARIKEEASRQMAQRYGIEIPSKVTRNIFVELPGQIVSNLNRELPGKTIRLFKPHAWRWENPENPADVRYLRPKGSIRWAMFKELMRWAGNGFWHKTVNHVTNLKPQAGELKLHILPDGSTDLEIYRNFTTHAPDGTQREERGHHYNTVQRNADKSSVDLGRIVKQIAKEKPEILKLNRAWQLKLASQTLTGRSDLPRSLDIQSVPEIPIHQLQVGDRGPQTATEAWEGIKHLPELKELNAIWSSGSEGLINPRETSYEATFPGSQPPTAMAIREETHSTGRRVVVNLWQGDNTAMAVYDDGIFNHPESARLNKADNLRSRQGTLKKGVFKRIGAGAAQWRTYFEIHSPAFGLGYLASLSSSLIYERLAWTPEQRDKIGTSPPLDYPSLKHELGAAFAMAAPASTSALIVDGVFNYVGGLSNSLVDKFQKGITWREAYAYNSPRTMNPPPASFRPIPEPAFRFGAIRQAGHPLLSLGRSLKWGMPYMRSLLQRGVPLLVGLFAVEGYRSLGKDWKFWNVVRGNLPPGARWNWENIANNFYHVGAVSLGSAALTNLAARRAELAVARQAAGQSIRGLGGYLLRNKWLAKAPKGMTGTYALTWRASLLTVAAEMAVLGIWDSYERKQELVRQGKDFRSELSRAMDRYNRVLSRLQHGEEISPTKLQEAESSVHMAQQHYQSYLKLMGHQDGKADFKSIGLENDYSQVYRSMFLENGAESQWEHQHKLQEMRLQEDRSEQKLRAIYRSHGINVADPEPGVDLREFLVRTTQTLKEDPQVLDKALQGHEEIHSPIAISSAEAHPVIEHLNWKMEKDHSFFNQTPQEQARYLLRTFSGYRVTLSDGKSRPWTEGEAMAFLHDLQIENQHRLENLQEPLLKTSAKNQPSAETVQAIAEEEKKVLTEGGKDNRHLGRLETELADNGTALEKQMENYFRRTSEKRDAALIQFLPQEFLVANQTATEPSVN